MVIRGEQSRALLEVNKRAMNGGIGAASLPYSAHRLVGDSLHSSFPSYQTLLQFRPVAVVQQETCNFKSSFSSFSRYLKNIPSSERCAIL